MSTESVSTSKMISRERIGLAVLAAGAIALVLSAAGTVRAFAPVEHQEQSEAVELAERGAQLVRDGKLEEALEVFDQAIEANDKYAQAHFQRGVTLAQLQRMEEAKEAFLRSTVLEPGVAVRHQYASLASRMLGDYETAWDQAVRAVLAGTDLSQFSALEQASTPTTEIQERLAAWRVYVVGVDTGELLARDEGPSNARRSSGRDDVRNELTQIQDDLAELKRLVSVAISDTPGFGLVTDAEIAEYYLVATVHSIAVNPRAEMTGELRLYRMEDNEVAFVRPVSFRNLAAESAVNVELAQFIVLLENWKAESE